MKIPALPAKPVIAAQLVIDSRESDAFRDWGSLDLVLFYFKNRSKYAKARESAKYYISRVRDAQKASREIRILRLAEWQTVCSHTLDLWKWSDRDLAFALALHRRAVAAVPPGDPRFDVIYGVRDELNGEAARRFLAAKLPVSCAA